MKKLLALLLCLSLVLSLAACGEEPAPTTEPTAAPTTEPTAEPTTEPTTAPTEPPMTVETLLNEMESAMAENRITKYDTAFGFAMEIEMETDGLEMSMDIAMDLAIDAVVAMDGSASYANTTTHMKMLGMDITDSSQVFTLVEDGTVVTYTYSDTVGQWMFADTGLTLEEHDDLGTNNDWLLELAPADLTLDELTRDLNGTTVYILYTESVTEFSESMAESIAGTVDADLSQVKIPTEIFVDTETFLPVQVNMDIQSMMDALCESLAASLVGEVTEETKITMTAAPVSAHFAYGETELPELPQEARDQAHNAFPITDLPTEGEASDLGNGSFVLPCGSEALTITCPENWSGEVYDTNNVWTYNEDQSLYADFYYLTGWTEDDFRDLVQQDADDLKDNDIFASSGEGPAYEGFTTMEAIGEGESSCYAWTPMGEGYFLVLLVDLTAEPDFETMLQDILGLVTPYTGEFPEKAVAEDLGDGSFSLPCGDQTVTITCPEGFTGEVYDVNNIWLYNSDETVYGDYYYWEGWTEDDILTMWVQPDADTLKTEGSFVSQGDGPDCEGYTTKVVIGSELSYYYAWTPMGDGYFLAYIYDFAGGDNSSELLPMLLDNITAE